MQNYIVLDLETTGFQPQFNKITEIGAIKIQGGEIVDSFNQLIDPEMLIPDSIIDITGITNLMIKNQPTIDEILPEFIDFCEDYPIMGHNIIFDFSFLKTNAVNMGLRFEKEAIDTLLIAKTCLRHLRSRSLSSLCEYYNIKRDNAHRAYDDALATYKLYQILKRDFYNEKTEKLFIPSHLYWKPKKVVAITKKQEKFLMALVLRHNIVLDKPIESFSKSEASRKIDHILNQYGRNTQAVIN